MPNDSTTPIRSFKPLGPDDVLHAHVLLKDSARWCQRAAARNAKGEPTKPFAADAEQWDVFGAIHVCIHSRQERLAAKFEIAYCLRRLSLIPVETPISTPSQALKAICAWNDDYTTMHSEILEVLAALGV